MLSMRFAAGLAGLALVAAATAPAAADEVTDQLDAARSAYEQGDYAGAVSELQFALNEIQAKLGGKYAEALPEAPAGWEAGEVESQSLGVLGGGISVARSYTRSDGDGEMTARLLSESPLVQMSMAMLANPALLGTQPNMKRVKIGSENALLDWGRQDRSGQVTLVLGGKVALVVEGRDLDKPDPAIDLMKSWDLAAVRKLAGL